MKSLKKYLACTLAALALTAATSAFAAQPIVPERTKLAAIDSRSYKNLLNRWESNAAALTPQEVAEVYYGAALQQGFNAAKQYTAIDQAFNSGDMTKAYTLTADALKSDPTNLRLLFRAFATASASTDNAIKALAPKYQARLLSICDAIFNSGLGVSESSPYQVTRSTDREDFIAKYLQPTAVEGTATLGQLDAVKLSLEGLSDPVIFFFEIFK